MNGICLYCGEPCEGQFCSQECEDEFYEAEEQEAEDYE